MEGRLKIGNNIVLYLKSGFRYSGKVIDISDKMIVIDDRYKGLVDISKDVVSSIEPFKEKKRE